MGKKILRPHDCFEVSTVDDPIGGFTANPTTRHPPPRAQTTASVHHPSHNNVSVVTQTSQ
eukprot:scaffold13975_cov69-Cyclotella_meneghiniana.AAC.4